MSRRFALIVLSFFSLLLLPLGAGAASAPIPAESFAWGENLGWINFGPARGGVIVSESGLSGYAWSARYGWINFNPQSSGQRVSNDSLGHLSGQAWVSGRGWLDMTGIRIGSEGRFEGIAGQAGSRVGRVSFNCSLCEVASAWRPNPPSGGGGLPPAQPPMVTPLMPPSIPSTVVSPAVPPLTEDPSESTSEPVSPPTPPAKPASPQLTPPEKLTESRGKPLPVRPGTSGSLIRPLGHDQEARLDIFSSAGESGYTIDIRPVAIDLHGYDPRIRPLGDFFFEVRAIDNAGKQLSLLPNPIKITLPLGSMMASETAAVYYFNETTAVWEKTDTAFTENNSAVLYSDRLGRFAVLEAGGAERLAVLQESSPWRRAAPLVFAALCLVVLPWLLRLVRIAL